MTLPQQHDDEESIMHAHTPRNLAIEDANDDDTDACAFPKARRRLVCSVSTDGQVTMAHRHGTGIILTREEARELYEFLGNTARAWLG